MTDDAFHEIQLNGKQLVFLFMVAIVVSSVIFLCGVLVGRGVRTERNLAAEVQQLQETPTPDAVTPPAAAATAGGADPTTAPPPAAVHDAPVTEKLDEPKETVELKAPLPAGQRPAAPPPASAKPSDPVTAKPVPAVAKAAAASATSSGAGDGFVVQIAALGDRTAAEGIVKRLNGKGYSAYVTNPPAGATPVYRVRVGSFRTRTEALTVAEKLEKEERGTKPFVTPR
jgi:cell division septation protein DedD